MRIVVDTNIIFSAILKSNSLIANIILTPKSKFNFYATDLLSYEISKHKQKLKILSGLSDSDLDKSTNLIIGKIKIIDAQLIPSNVYNETEVLLQDIDPDDTEFVALTEYISGVLWSGDKVLYNGLRKKKWDKFVTTNELHKILIEGR